MTLNALSASGEGISYAMVPLLGWVGGMVLTSNAQLAEQPVDAVADKTSTQEWDILHVEDNDDDAFIVARAFKSAGVSCRIARCKDGLSAIAYLKGETPYRDRSSNPLPHLLLLDLKLPLRNGLEVLRWLRSDNVFHSQIVIVLTSSSETRDVEYAYGLHVNAYLTKPSSLNEMVDLANCIRTCWLEQVALHSLSLSH